VPEVLIKLGMPRSKESARERERKVLRVEIDGTWTAQEFADFFKSITVLYGLRTVLEIRPRERPWGYDRNELALHEALIEALRSLEPIEQLYVRRIQFASPGSIDLVGIGAIVGHVKDLLLRIIDLAVSAERRRLENEGLHIENERRRIENEKERLELEERKSVIFFLGGPDDEELIMSWDAAPMPRENMPTIIRTVFDTQGKLKELVQQGKILSATTVEDKTPKG
jgi:hypothetical protein